MSFHDDGTAVSSGQGSVVFNADPRRTQVESDGLGAWVRLDWRTVGRNNVAVLSDLNGDLAGFFRVRGVYQLASFPERLRVLIAARNVLFTAVS